MSRGKSIALWVAAFVLMFASASYQRRTGPTYELKGTFEVAGESYDYELIRSHNTDGDAPVTVTYPGGDVRAVLYWKRLGTDDDFTTVTMAVNDGEFRGMLPAQPAAGKLEYYVKLYGGAEPDILQDGEEPAVIRFKDPVTPLVLIPHIAFMFFAVFFGLRVALGAVVGQDIRKLAWVTMTLMGVGGMILGPIVQKQAFGAFWTGWPFGYDLTDNKTLIMWLVWVVAVAVLQLKPDAKRLGRGVVLVGAVVMMVVYLIPHSLRGSELDYSQIEEGVAPEEAVTTGSP